MINFVLQFFGIQVRFLMYKSGTSTGMFQYKSLLRSLNRSWWSRNYIETWSRSRNIFIINIFCSQFEGCLDEEKLISTSVSDPDSLNLDPDPAKNLNPDPDPGKFSSPTKKFA